MKYRASLVLLLSAASILHGQVTDGTYLETAGNGDYTTPGAVSGGQEDSTATATITPGWDPSVSAVAQTANSGIGEAEADAELTYYFEVISWGVSPDSEIPVDIVANGTSDASGQDQGITRGMGQAGGEFSAPGIDISFGKPDVKFPSSFSVDQVVDIQPNVVYSVYLNADANVIG